MTTLLANEDESSARGRAGPGAWASGAGWGRCTECTWGVVDPIGCRGRAGRAGARATEPSWGEKAGLRRLPGRPSSLPSPPPTVGSSRHPAPHLHADSSPGGNSGGARDSTARGVHLERRGRSDPGSSGPRVAAVAGLPAWGCRAGRARVWLTGGKRTAALASGLEHDV